MVANIPRTYSVFLLCEWYFYVLILIQTNLTLSHFTRNYFHSLCFCWSYLSFCAVTSFQCTANICSRTRAQDSFRLCDLCSRNFLANTNNFVFVAILLSCLFSELHDSGFECRTIFPGYGLCSYNPSSEINNFGLCTVLVSYLSFLATETTFTSTRTKENFWNFDS
jgi:hypothetical protein